MGEQWERWVQAIQDLPPGPRAWFEGWEGFVKAHSSDPDRWKTDPREGRRHWLEVEPYGGPQKVPLDLAQARTLVGEETLQKAGTAPWVIQDRVRDLVAAFQKKNPKEVAFLASILSHYVGDLHVPLHTSVNYDGQLTGQRGVHSRWETGLVERMEGEPEARTAVLEKGLFQAPWKWIQESYALTGPVLADDKASGGRSGLRPENVYWLAFAKRQGPAVKERLSQAAYHTAQLILLAWNSAGKPEAPKPPSDPVRKEGPAPGEGASQEPLV
jgi:hypothetical protein